MRTRRWNRLVQLVMAAALLVTGLPLLRPWLPAGPLPAAPSAKEDRPPIPGRIVVDVRDSLTPAELQALNSRYGLALAFADSQATAGKLLVASVPVGREDAIIARLRKDRLVEAADRMNLYHTNWTPNDPRFKEQWNMRMIGAEAAWDKTAGKGVTVAVIDTGVAFENDDRCYQGKDFGGTHFAKGYDFVHHDEHPNDDHGHGTHVAGTIAETTNNGEGVAGLAYAATVMPLKVLDESGSGSSAAIAEAIRYAADRGAQVINMSLGGPYPDSVMRAACQYAVKKGVLIVCAAGNSGGGPVGYPAGYPECLAVSAVGPGGNLAPYSSIGKQVAIAAPGGDTNQGEAGGILQNTVRYDTDGREDGYYSFQGTSMASPHVAAAAALAISRGVNDPAAVRQILERAATPKEPREQYGAGILNAAKAVDLADGDERNPGLLLLFTTFTGGAALGLGILRDRAAGRRRFPAVPIGLLFGLVIPDLVTGWLGLWSPLNLIIHSALIPLYLLWEAESQPVYRFLSGMALGASLHLCWDLLRGYAPFAGVAARDGIPWLWVNVIVGLGVALVAWRRSHAQP